LGRQASGRKRSFLKKRTKKLLSIEAIARPNVLPWSELQKGKSFLFLFFKKEMLPFFTQWVSLKAGWFKRVLGASRRACWQRWHWLL
jgi:hypothetical protein